MKKRCKPKNILRSSQGFTLIEAMMSVILLGIIAYGISPLYISGLSSLNDQADRMLLDSRLRGRMEMIISKGFDLADNGSESIGINGRDYTLTWTAVFVDLNGDGTPEPDAKQVTVSVAGMPDRALMTIMVNNMGRLGKI